LQIAASSTSIDSMQAKAWTSAQIADWQRAQLIAAGYDTSVVKDEPLRFLRLPEVCKRVGLSKPSVYRRIADGRFPRPISLS
jgi:hypothetical protein